MRDMYPLRLKERSKYFVFYDYFFSLSFFFMTVVVQQVFDAVISCTIGMYSTANILNVNKHVYLSS